jgi:hypothetical protein
MSTIPPPKPEELQTSTDEVTGRSRLLRKSAWTALAVLVAALVILLILIL